MIGSSGEELSDWTGGGATCNYALWVGVQRGCIRPHPLAMQLNTKGGSGMTSLHPTPKVTRTNNAKSNVLLVSVYHMLRIFVTFM